MIVKADDAHGHECQRSDPDDAVLCSNIVRSIVDLRMTRETEFQAREETSKRGEKKAYY
jgi:hypothetical protein